MDSETSPPKKLRSPAQDIPINTKTSITCSNVPDSLFDANTAKKHFSKFGRVQRIRLFPKRQMCIIEYDQPTSAERAVLNAGAFDGFMFDVTRSKARVRRRSKKDDDPDWVPDSEVEEELSAMGGAPSYIITRQHSAEGKIVVKKTRESPRAVKPTSRPVIKKKIAVAYHPSIKMNQPQAVSGTESPVQIPTIQSSLSTIEAAAELHQLRFRVSQTPDEQWRTLEARDKVLRGWGGAGSRVKVGGATIGTCQDMCPEKERLHRHAEHQVMTLETVPDSDGLLEPWRAVKQYSRSSADQEIPMCYELRPAPVLMRTCAYLLHEIADTKRQVSLADWFHFMWDRLRGIRKDITQQAMCCAESIRLVEMCARFHAHCAARLADLEHTQFDQKLNTDNLTKCLQTLKHMYADVGPEQKPNESEFRGYIALLNLGDANFWWEIKQLSPNIQKSSPLVFATQVFNAIDNNNYIKFFRLVHQRATYLQACILLRYFNDVRARALARIVKAYAPRGSSRFPADELINALAFESIESMKHFINHYGLRFAKTEFSEDDLSVILDRNSFIEDIDPYPIARAISLIESKRHISVGEVIAGGVLPDAEYKNHILFTSFNEDGRLKESALLAEEQGYNTMNDSNKNIGILKDEISRLGSGEKFHRNTENIGEQKNLFVKPESNSMSPVKPNNIFATPKSIPNKFSFKPAIHVAPTEIIKNSPEKVFESDAKSVFSFSKPQDSAGSNIFSAKNTSILFKPTNVFKQNVFGKPDSGNMTQQEPGKPDNANAFMQPTSQTGIGNIFKQKEVGNSVFAQFQPSNRGNENIFDKPKDTKFAKPDSTVKFGGVNSIFAGAAATSIGDGETKTAKRIFGVFNNFNKVSEPSQSNIFLKSNNTDGLSKTTISLPNSNADASPKTPGSIFKKAIMENGTDSIFSNKIKGPSVANEIFNSVENKRFNEDEKLGNYDQYSDNLKTQENNTNQESVSQEEIRKEQERKEALRLLEAQRRLEDDIKKKKEEEQRRNDEEKRRDEARKKQEEKLLEEKRRKEREEKEREERRKEMERKAELQRIADEAEKEFRERVDKESFALINEFIEELSEEHVSILVKEEKEIFNSLMLYADKVTTEIITELNNEICSLEMKAVKFRIDKVRRKWFTVWKKQTNKNVRRRNLLDDTPVWLTDSTPFEEATHLKRLIENATLKNMNAIHKGYKFSGEMTLPIAPKPYDLMEIIRSPLLKRMKQINYPYDKCFFWKVTLVSPGSMKWLYRKIEIEKWLIDSFSDRKKHDESDSLIHVGKYSWNHLMEFAISVSMMHKDNTCNEAMEGTNGVLMYATEKDFDLSHTVEVIIKNKYPYQIIPIAIIVPKAENLADYSVLESLLTNLQNNKFISDFKIFIIEPQNVSNSLSLATKTALKWLAKKCPQNPPIEIDLLKSICQRYLANEIWCNLKSLQDSRMNVIRKDLFKLVKCYNTAVDKLTSVLTNEDLFNHPTFPLEFKVFLDTKSPYPKPYEFITSNVRNSENVLAIKEIMKQLKLPNPLSQFHPSSIMDMQQQIRKYCNQICWFEKPEEVFCRVVALLPNEFTDIEMPRDQFNTYFAHYDLIDILNIIVYEKINNLKNFDNRFAVYEKSVLIDYRNIHWLFDIEVLRNIKHKVIDFEDELDFMIEAKRRKLAMDSMEPLMLDDKDCTIVEENIKANNERISRYNNCSETVKQLEEQIENEKKKSLDLENLLKYALSDV